MKSVGNIAEADSSARAALEIMRDWEWGFIDYDGQRVAYSKPLSVAISKLGMTGLARPQDAVLFLLCHGELIARGDFFWQKYEDGSAHRLNGNISIIVPQRWMALATIMEQERQSLADGLCSLSPVNLPRLGLSGCAAFEWNFPANQIGTAMRSAGGGADDLGDIEEMFWAWEIEVWPKFLFEREPEPTNAPTVAKGNKGGAPRKWDWDGALLHLAALAHHGDSGLFRADGGDPNQSDIARYLQAWFLQTCDRSPEDSQLRKFGARFVEELNALKLAHPKDALGKG